MTGQKRPTVADIFAFVHLRTKRMFLTRRNRILRQSAAIREMVAETRLGPSDFIVPLFIVEGKNEISEIGSMPGYYRRSIDETVKEVKELWGMG